MDSVSFRSLFPALDTCHWFATPGVAPGASPVADALHRFATEWSDGSFDWKRWEGDAETTRTQFASLVNADPTSVALLQSLAEAAATIARGVLPSLPSGEIVVADREFRSNLMPWLTFAASRHRIRAVRHDGSSDWTDRVLASITPRTVFVALSEVQSASGARIPTGAVIDKCHAVGAQVFLNLTQSAGVLECDVRRWEVDYAAAHGYKWLLAPRGAAWLYVRRDRLHQLTALAPNWKNAPDPLNQMYGAPASLAPDARRLDGSLAWPSWVGARAALELIGALSASQVEHHCLSVAAHLKQGLRDAGFDVLDAFVPSHIVAARILGAERVAADLAASKVVATARDGFLRFGCHYFNTIADVDAALSALSLSLV